MVAAGEGLVLHLHGLRSRILLYFACNIGLVPGKLLDEFTVTVT